MNTRTILASLLLTAGTLAMCSDLTPDQLRDQGLEALKAAQSDESKVVEAARLLTKAVKAYESAGKDNEASELNSYLYWCKKKMTVQQIDVFLAGGSDEAKAALAKMEAVEKSEVKAEEAAIWLARADGFFEGSRNPFLSAVRYFEVAERFIGTKESMIAQRKSLDLISKVAPVAPVANHKEGVPVYLADMNPIVKRVHKDRLFTGTVADGSPIRIGGRLSPKSLFMHSTDRLDQCSLAAWELNGKFSAFSASVSLEDGATDKANSTFVFKVIGDGKVLWVSRKISGKVADRCSINVSGVKILELQTWTEKNSIYGWLVWVDPIVK